MSAAAQASVRLRCPRGAFWSALMPAEKAETLANDLEQQIERCGDGWAFVAMAGYDGRGQRVRGRDVFAVEVIPESALSEPRRLPHGVGNMTGGGVGNMTGGGVGNGITMQLSGAGQGEGGESPGTAFLRRQMTEHLGHVGGARR